MAGTSPAMTTPAACIYRSTGERIERNVIE
jgi:hypothetical protein